MLDDGFVLIRRCILRHHHAAEYDQGRKYKNQFLARHCISPFRPRALTETQACSVTDNRLRLYKEVAGEEDERSFLSTYS
jgi:hypothetical protein